MGFSLWLYLPLLAALVAVLLFGADRLAKACELDPGERSDWEMRDLKKRARAALRPME